MSELNENHQRKLLTTCQYVDELLTGAVGRMVQQSPVSPLRSYIPDATPEQISALRRELEHLRQVMVNILRENNIALQSPQISSLWAFRTALTEVGEVVFDLRAKSMNAYGPLTPEAQKQLDEIAAQLTRQIEALVNVFNNLTAENQKTGREEIRES